MEVNVKDSLARARVHIEDGPVPSPMSFPLPRDPGSRLEHLAQQQIVVGAHVVQRRDVFLRYNQHVNRRLRVDIFESQNLVIFVHSRRRDLAGDDLAKQAVRHPHTLA